MTPDNSERKPRPSVRGVVTIPKETLAFMTADELLTIADAALIKFAYIASNYIGSTAPDADVYRPPNYHRVCSPTIGELRAARVAYEAIGKYLREHEHA